MKPIQPLLNKDLTRPNWLSASPRDKNFIWLDKNENLDEAYISWINNKIKKKIKETDFSTYPDLKKLYLKISEFDAIEPNKILLTAGSDGAIRTVFHSFVDKDDLVFITSPSFAMYEVYCKMFGARTHRINYDNFQNQISIDIKNLIFDINKLKPKLICIPNPDSPTGTTLSLNEIESILKICKKNKTILLIDEAYMYFYDISVLGLLDIYSDNLIICRTFSKAWGLAGIRVGYIISNSDSIEVMNKIRPMYEIGATSLKIVQEILNYPKKMMDSVNRIKLGKLFFETELKKLGFEVLDTQGNFSHVKFGKFRNEIFSELDKIVYYRKDFKQDCLKGFSRFSSAPKNIMRIIINNIKKILS